MPPTATSESDSRRYSTRLRRRMDIEKKYDDIFSSVVEQALSNESLRMSPPPAPLYEKKPVIRKRYVSDSYLSPCSRSVSECDSLDHRDVTVESDSLAPSSENSNDHSDIEIIAVVPSAAASDASMPSVEWKFVCECGRRFMKHQQLHHHLAIDHSPSNSSHCTKCFINTKALRNAHICRICHQYTVSMDEHLRAHYQDRSGENALMECRRCYRAFPTLAEVRDHERRMHTSHRVHKTNQSWACNYCNVLFATRHMRDAHLVAHIDRAVGGVWDKIAHMQELTTDQTLVNQCPMCYSVMGSRKSFRLHIIHKHLLQDPDHAISSLGLPTVADVVASMNQTEPKCEVKAESMNDDVIVKAESMEDDVIDRAVEGAEADNVQVKEELMEWCLNYWNSMDLPVLLITNGVLLPEARLKVPIRSKTNLAMLDRFVVNKSGTAKSLILVAYRVEQEKKVFETGTVALVEQVVCWRYNTHVQYTLHLVGVSRARIENFAVPVCSVKQLYSVEGDLSSDLRAEFSIAAKELAKSISVENMEAAFTIKKLINEDNMDALADFCVSLLHDISFSSLLDYLATLEVSQRVSLACDWMRDHIKSSSEPPFVRDALRVETLQGPSGPRKVNQRPKNPVDDLESRLNRAGLPEHVKDRVWSDLERMKSMGQQGSEQHVLAGYLELVASLPWNNASHDTIDIKKARGLLEASHDGMDTVKKRVLEYLAVRKLNNSLGGPILCFAGPPGIGKTSVAKAIAEALGRKFERLSLGGVRDESDIRGHRRTYVAAMPGRIIQAVKHAGTNNPVILLDEVDKLFSGLHGSPSAALLEVLDPEQNSGFTDHYLNLPFDLSNVMFVATANDLSKIDGPLSDRLEIIEMSGYSTAEKAGIASRHIVPRQLSQHGICPDHLHIQEDAIRTIVECYTRESGVRQLERGVASLCRHSALRLAEALNADTEADCMMDLDLPIVIDEQQCREIMGREQYSRLDIVDKMGRFGLGTCFGMAWTPFGGEVLVIEANHFAGSGKILMTGKLGDVLRESVDVARTWIKANAGRYNASTLADSDLHVHLPSGGVNKDGPSAGCAIVSALFSLACGRNVRSDTAITGEISLNGQVLPVGGIKEKVLGAHRAGLRRVIIPEANRKDTDNIDSTVKAEMELHFASDIDDVLDKIIEKKPRIDVLSKL